MRTRTMDPYAARAEPKYGFTGRFSTKTGFGDGGCRKKLSMSSCRCSIFIWPGIVRAFPRTHSSDIIPAINTSLYHRKTALPFSCPYGWTVVSSSAVSMKVGKPTFILAYLNWNGSSRFSLKPCLCQVFIKCYAPGNLTQPGTCEYVPEPVPRTRTSTRSITKELSNEPVHKNNIPR